MKFREVLLDFSVKSTDVSVKSTDVVHSCCVRSCSENYLYPAVRFVCNSDV